MLAPLVLNGALYDSELKGFFLFVISLALSRFYIVLTAGQREQQGAVMLPSLWFEQCILTFSNHSAGRQAGNWAEMGGACRATADPLLNHRRQKYFNAVDLEKGQNLDYLAWASILTAATMNYED